MQVMTPEMAEEMAKQQAKQREERLAQILGKIKDAKPKDRLEYAFEIARMIAVLNMSIDGWEKWSNLATMNAISEKELKEIFSVLKPITEAMIAFDIRITKRKLEEWFAKAKKEREKQEKAKEQGKPSNSKRTYVS